MDDAPASLTTDDLLLNLSTTMAQLAVVIRRERTEAASKPSDPAPPPNSPVLEVYRDLVRAISTGGDVKSLMPKVRQFVSAQESRSRVFAGLTLAHGFERIDKFQRARAVVEDALLSRLTSGSMSVAEMLAATEYFDAQLTRAEKSVNNSAGGITDVAALLEKLGVVAEEAPSKIGRVVEGTTPAGRDVIRKIGYALLTRTTK